MIEDYSRQFVPYLKCIILVTMTNRILHGMEIFEQFWKKTIQGSFLCSLVKFNLVV